MAGLIGIGLSGILGHQSALNTTGNNITNANTPGYSRQEVQFDTQAGRNTGNGRIGSGVSVENIRRLADQYLVDQVRADSSLYEEQKTLNTELSRLDDLLGGEDTGLSKSLNNFFASLQNAAEDPASLPQRQLVLSEAQGVVNRFQAIQQELIQQRELVKAQMNEGVEDANTLIKSIAELNLAISESPGLAQGRLPNDLLDKRDEALRKLSEQLKVRVVPTDGQQVNVLLNNGQALVVGAEASQLGTRRNADDPSALEFTLNNGGRITVVNEQVVGGKLGGLRRFDQEALRPAFDELGRVAIALSDAMNHQHEIGMDLEGDLGGRFFRDINSPELQTARVIASSNNQPPQNAVLGVEITDSSRLEAGAWTLQMSGTDGRNYELIDQQSGRVVNQGQLPAQLPAEISMPGFNIRVESGDFAEGDRFQIQPSRQAASDIVLEVEREEDLAFASPIRAVTDNGNSGDARIDQGQMLAIRNPLTNAPLPAFSQRGELSPPLMVRFISDSQYEILDATDPAVPQPLNPPVIGDYQQGITNKLFSEDPSDDNYRGFQFAISGNPRAGDSFIISYNSNGVSDNRNAELLAGLATRNTMNDGTQSFTEGYAGLVERIGVQTRQAQLDSDSGKTLLEQSNNQREAVSGVNLDEEAGRLIQYQAAYNASARVMGVAQDLFDTLLSTFR
ncbi:flagellar hook-associated protein 1 FlgK [Marinobacter daqiaonensis]|uniref:Flagellar hook-associated protein 1 n=1 Tax=Marinobacter daqiaonensis TaxID=650891 RepID=A0A1I6GLC9_9GAMM|nr:flagellar hook-associated protein FlgK [Marinobacter daqiaonensis]SFR42867.1 flagellar hook-associated protein 1 FlgK [Marinobacter daqiaonensis]